jgi:hypothetical protein
MIPNCLRLDLPLKRMQKPKQKTSSSIPLHCNVNGRHPAEKGQYLKIIASLIPLNLNVNLYDNLWLRAIFS